MTSSILTALIIISVLGVYIVILHLHIIPHMNTQIRAGDEALAILGSSYDLDVKAELACIILESNTTRETVITELVKCSLTSSLRYDPLHIDSVRVYRNKQKDNS